MPASWITMSNASEVRVAHPVDNTGERAYDLINDVRFQDTDKAKVAETLKSTVQEDLTTRIRLIDLPDDEPVKTTDPVATHGERMFWEGNGLNRELVSRSTIVESVVWNGERFIFTLRRAR